MNCVTKIFIPTTPIADKLIWIADPKGIFSVKFCSQITTKSHMAIPSRSNMAKAVEMQVTWKVENLCLAYWYWRAPYQFQCFLQTLERRPMLPPMQIWHGINLTSFLQVPCHKAVLVWLKLGNWTWFYSNYYWYGHCKSSGASPNWAWNS